MDPSVPKKRKGKYVRCQQSNASPTQIFRSSGLRWEKVPIAGGRDATSIWWNGNRRTNAVFPRLDNFAAWKIIFISQWSDESASQRWTFPLFERKLVFFFSLAASIRSARKFFGPDAAAVAAKVSYLYSSNRTREGKKMKVCIEHVVCLINTRMREKTQAKSQLQLDFSSVLHRNGATITIM